MSIAAHQNFKEDTSIAPILGVDKLNYELNKKHMTYKYIPYYH